MTVWLAIRLIVLGAALWFAYHLGGLAGAKELAQWQARTAELTSTAVIAERNSSQRELDRLNEVVAQYEKASLTPVDPGTVHRLFIYAAAHCNTVSKAPATPGTAPATGGILTGTGAIEQAVERVFQAGQRDELRLNLCREAWPR